MIGKGGVRGYLQCDSCQQRDLGVCFLFCTSLSSPLNAMQHTGEVWCSLVLYESADLTTLHLVATRRGDRQIWLKQKERRFPLTIVSLTDVNCPLPKSLMTLPLRSRAQEKLSAYILGAVSTFEFSRVASMKLNHRDFQRCNHKQIKNDLLGQQRWDWSVGGW